MNLSMNSFFGCLLLSATWARPARDLASGVIGGFANADASLAATDSTRAEKFVEALWNTPTPDGPERYYEGLLYLMGLLHRSGEFKIWNLR
jgi:oligosaccharide reducing-end xylanase